MRHGEIPCHAGLLRVKKEHISVLAQIAVLATPAAMVLHQGDAAIDPDVGWHLQTANWILQHHALPHSDPFSYTRAGAPWAAYSWLFELLLGGFYRILGLRGIVLYTALMALVISWALLRLLSRYVEPIPAAALTAVTYISPILCSGHAPACSLCCSLSFSSTICCELESSLMPAMVGGFPCYICCG